MITTTKANPEDLRKALMLVDSYKKAGIMFVPLAVLNEEDLEDLKKQASERLDTLAEALDGRYREK